MPDTLQLDGHTLMACYWGCYLHSLGIHLGGHSGPKYLNSVSGRDLTPSQWLQILKPAYESMVAP